MRTITLESGTKIKVYDSSREMPIVLYSRMQSYLVQESGIGSDMGDVIRHFAKLDALIASGKNSEAATERHNLHFNLFAMLQEFSFESLAFGCMVQSIDGEAVTDYSEEGIKEMTENLSKKGLTKGDVEDALEALKKKWMQS